MSRGDVADGVRAAATAGRSGALPCVAQRAFGLFDLFPIFLDRLRGRAGWRREPQRVRALSNRVRSREKLLPPRTVAVVVRASGRGAAWAIRVVPLASDRETCKHRAGLARVTVSVTVALAGRDLP